MTAETTRSRRELLAAAAGALGVMSAEALVRAAPARANTGDPVIAGKIVTASNTTEIDSSDDGLFVSTPYGHTAVIATTTGPGDGIRATTQNGRAVYGVGAYGKGVFATSGGAVGAVHGQNNNVDADGYGVFGEHQAHGIGVFGQTDSEGAAGVWGDNASGPGVKGTSGYIGVYGAASGGAGVGVWGFAETDSGTAVQADAGGTNGTALNVIGPAVFLLSGVTSIPAGAKSATVTGVSLRSASLVLATVQNLSGVMVRCAIPIVSQSSIRILLNKAVPSGQAATVAWFVVN